MRAMATALGAVAILAGCGGGPAQPARSIKVTMTGVQFAPSTISAPSGQVVFFPVKSGTTSHNMIIPHSSNKRLKGSDLVSAGDSFVFTVDSIAAGTYTYFCDQQGHEASGMKGTLTIT